MKIMIWIINLVNIFDTGESKYVIKISQTMMRNHYDNEDNIS